MLRVNTRVDTQGDRTGGEERLNSKHSALTKITSVTVGVNSEGPPGIGQRSAVVNPWLLDPNVCALSYWTGQVLLQVQVLLPRS